MILVVTMNPSVDIAYPLNSLTINGVNRVSTVRKEAGGKGLNVTKVIRLAGEEVLVTGLIGGLLGQYITTYLDNAAIQHHFSHIAQASRNCIAILHEGLQTEILEAGPTVTPQELAQFTQLFSQLLTSASTVVLSGSLPTSVPTDFYQQLITIAKGQKKKVLLDCSGESLQQAIRGKHAPYLIKPNKQELEQLIGKRLDLNPISAFIEAMDSCTELQAIPWVVVSLGKAGALAKIEKRYWRVTIPQINAVNAVGSGDATLAGLAMGIMRGETKENTLKSAMAFGMLNALEPRTGHINMHNFKRFFDDVTVAACE